MRWRPPPRRPARAATRRRSLSSRSAGTPPWPGACWPRACAPRTAGRAPWSRGARPRYGSGRADAEAARSSWRSPPPWRSRASRAFSSPRAPTASTGRPTRPGRASTAGPWHARGRAASTRRPRSPRPTATRCSTRPGTSSAPDPRAPTSPIWWWRSAPRAKGAGAMRALAGNVSELFVSFQGEGVHAGRRQLFARLGGCPLRCRYCDEPESLVPVAECRILGPDGMRRRANPFSPAALDAEVTALAAAAPPLHAIAVTGGEPLAQADFLASWLALRTNTLPVLLETAGILPARLPRVLPWVAIVSFDVKCPSNTGERARWDEHDACFRMAVAAGRAVYVKMPVDEGTAPAEVERGARLVAEAAPGAPLFLTPLTEPTTPRLTIGAGTLERLHALASRVHPDVRVLPQLHKVLGIP